MSRGLRAIQQQGTVKRYYIYAGDKLLGEFQGGYPQVAYTWGADGLVSQRLFRIQVIAFEAVVAGQMLEAPLSQMEDETDQSGYAVSALGPPDVTPIPLGSLTLWYHFGPQTETRYLTDETGAVTYTYLYDAYGKAIATTGTFYNHHRYGGKYGYHSNLNAAGFILAGQRWYSPHLRRWISRDPIGYQGDDNLYEYVGGMPTIKVDPTGLLEAVLNPTSGAAVLDGVRTVGPALTALGPVAAEAALYAGAVMAGGALVACYIDHAVCENMLISCGVLSESAYMTMDPSLEAEIAAIWSKVDQPCVSRAQLAYGVCGRYKNLGDIKACYKRVQGRLQQCVQPKNS